eukprot:jgi/Bigna1/127992/aug1.5_g2700
MGYFHLGVIPPIQKNKVKLAEKSGREEGARGSGKMSGDLGRVKKGAKEAQEAFFSGKQLEMITRTGMEMQARVSDEANKAKAEGRRLETKLQLQAERSERLEKQIQDGEGIWAAQRAKMLKEAKRVRGALDQKEYDNSDRGPGRERETYEGNFFLNSVFAWLCSLLLKNDENERVVMMTVDLIWPGTEQSLQERLEDLETQHRKEIDEMSARLEEAYKMHDEAERRGEQSLIEQTGITKKVKRLQGTLDENDAEKQRLITEKNQALRKLELFDQGKTVDLVETLTSLADDARGGEDPLLIGTSVLSPSRDAYPRGEPLAPLDIEGFESDDGNVAKNHLNFSAAAGGNGAEDDLLRVSAEEYKQVIKELGDAGRT